MVDVINPSITAGIGTQNQINPLGMLGQYAQIQNHLLQAQLYKAKQAAGQLYTQSLDSEGQPDLGKYGALLASHPETSMYAADAMNEAVQTRKLNAEAVNTQLHNKQTQMDGLAVVCGHQLRQPPCHALWSPIDFSRTFAKTRIFVKEAKAFARTVFQGMALLAHAHINPEISPGALRFVHFDPTPR